jgi:ubiquinol-cytochrome c reductase cytochrome b subunit
MSSVEIDRQWTTRLRKRVEGKLPPEKVLPDTQPSYVSSWIYVFGVATLTSFVLVLLTGCVLALRGPQWWHESNYGHFVNSLHLWSVEIFFFSMVIHLWGKYFMAAWRGGRQLTWMTGGITFLVSIAAGFTGYVSQSNFDSQWISTQAKDGINATGAGAYFNVLNLGQMLMWHIVLLPLVAVLLTTVHVVMVRIRGVVPPFTDDTKVA